jgi:hypothetical protein
MRKSRRAHFAVALPGEHLARVFNFFCFFIILNRLVRYPYWALAKKKRIFASGLLENDFLYAVVVASHGNANFRIHLVPGWWSTHPRKLVPAVYKDFYSSVICFPQIYIIAYTDIRSQEK